MSIKRRPVVISLLPALILAVLAGQQTSAPPALAQSEITTMQVEPAPKKPEKHRVLPSNQEEQLVTGTLASYYFRLKKASRKKNTIVLEGGDLDPANAGKGKSSITIEFSSAQKFPGEIYQISYNSGDAKTRYGGVTKAPKVTYVTVDKTGKSITTTATNSSSKDEQDYTMELELFPVNKKGQLPGYLHMQIGTSPISELKGYFYAQ